MEIEPNRVVFIRYVMKNRAGEILEDIMNREPIGFLFGSNAIHETLQQQLLGFKAGDKVSLFLHLSAYEDFVFEVIVDAVRLANNAELMLGYPLQSSAKCEADCVCYDENVPNIQ